MCIRDSMDPQHLAEGSFPKDEKSVYESFLCKHVQLHCPAYTAQRSTGSKSLSTLDNFSACTRYVLSLIHISSDFVENIGLRPNITGRIFNKKLFLSRATDDADSFNRFLEIPLIQ